MMRSIPFILRIILIYIIVKLFNCSVYADRTEHLETAFNDRQYQKLSALPTNGGLFTYDGDSRAPGDEQTQSSQRNDENNEAFSTKSNENVLLDKNSEFDSLNETTTRHKRQSEREDICNIAECTCKVETKFLTVDCHFQQHYTLDERKSLRPAAETLLIKLSRNAEFRLGGNVFNDNHFNRIVIQGDGIHSGEHVEISSNAFHGNNGPFPEIEIVNVHTVIIRPNAFYSEFQLNVTNCAKVWIYPESFANTTFHGYFGHIRDFHLKERAFSKSEAKISIEHSKLDELQPLEAALKQIKFSNSRIGEIRYRAFDVLQINSIVFENCTIDTIKGQALTGKLNSNYFALIGCVIGTIEKLAIHGSGISEIIIRNNNITNIQTKAIKVVAVTTLIQGNNFDFTERFWFNVDRDWTNVIIENNHFGVYQQMGIEIASHPKRCIFENNFITETFAGSLSFKNPNCRIKEVSFDRLCSCNATFFSQLTHIDISAESYCKMDDTLTHCFNASLYNLKAYKEDICDASTQIDCVRDRINAKPNGYFINLDRMFNRNVKLLYVYLGGGGVLVIVIVVLLGLIICRCMRKKKKNVDDGVRDMALMESLHPTTAALNAQHFDQTFRPIFDIFPHTNMMIINKTLEDMKHKYPPEFYDQVYNNTQKLIVGHLTETDKVKTIGEIVQCIDECENTGVDFKAFTDILYNHLGSGNEPVHQIHAPIYAEPSLTRLDVLPQTERRNELNAAAAAAAAAGAAEGGEHIYAEPVALQQPLLRNDYNVPIDNNENPNHMYTEPITGGGAIDYISSAARPTNQINLTPDRLLVFDTAYLYAKPSTSAKNRKKSQTHESTPTASTSFSSQEPRSNLPKISHFKNSAHSSSQESNNSHSDYSGGSGATLPLNDPI